MSKSGKKESAEYDLSQLPPLPEGWVWCVPSQICRLVASGSTPSSDKMYEGRGEVPFIKVYNLTHDGSLNFKHKPTFIDRCTHEKLLARSRVMPGDVLMNIVGPPLGKVSVVPDQFPEWNINQAIVVFRPEEGVSNKYIAAALLTDSIISRVTSLAKATAGQHNIGVSMCRSLLPIPLAPANEQRRIVAKIDELFSDLDAAVAGLKRVQTNLKRYRAAVLKAAVEGRLTAEWRKKNRPKETGPQLLDRILAERRHKWEEEQLAAFAKAGKTPPTKWKEKYKEPAGPDCTNLPALPEGWCWATLEALAVIEGGIAKDQKRAITSTMREVPYLRVANVQRGFLDLAEIKTILAEEDEIHALELKEGDVLFTEGGDRDKLGRGWVWHDEIDECIHQNHIFRARPLSDLVEPRFISYHGNYFGRTWFIRAGKQTTNLASINKGVLSQFPVPLPPSEEQRQIVDEVDRRLSTIREAEGQIDADMRRSTRLRQAILRRAFEGKLVPQDPADEPATLLLQRLYEQRDRPPEGRSREHRRTQPEQRKANARHR